MNKIPKELKPLEDQITLIELIGRGLSVLTGEAISDTGIDIDNLKKLIRKKVGIDNLLYKDNMSDSLDKLQEKAYSLKKELLKFKTELELDLTEKVKSAKDPGGRFSDKTASIKNVIKKHLSEK